MFLSKEEMHSLTGCKHKNLQKQWLLSHGYMFDLNAAGWPIVLKKHIEEILSHQGAQSRKGFEPNLKHYI